MKRDGRNMIRKTSEKKSKNTFPDVLGTCPAVWKTKKLERTIKHCSRGYGG
jgi:Holliday junction resolvase